ncbi:M1-specific T cell receptor beta chain-like [Pelmatolapia mariae]|uniref:M1-specific T cell receptor beta chain-like n=1 Tax=Pelmatolapia mariae TaxID=158779 RepID=UPI002FE59683
MIILLLSIYLNNILVSGSTSSDQVDQTPADIYTKGEDAKVYCSHSIQNYNKILWYKQSEKQLQYLGYMNIDKGYPEPGVNVTMDGGANQKENCTLTIKDLKLSSSGVYFCAARRTGREAYFGKGTKLTVLEKDRTATPPQEVQILRPSDGECRNSKDKKRKKTLVCVASGFYPDHVEVYWQMNEKNVTDGVATDEAAREGKDDNDKTVYKITSRLRVYAKQWENPDNTFKCVVNFFNGSVYTDYPKSIEGVTAKTTSMSREKYLTTTQNFKVVYSVLTVKSCAYGAFVGFLVWKLQRFGGKQKY